MIIDNFLLFTGTSNGATSTIANGTHTDAPTTGTQYSSNIIDLGVSGLPTSANGGGARDIGVGDDPMLKLLINVTTTFAYQAGGGTTTFTLQGGIDNGSGSPTWGTDMWSSAAIPQASLVQGAQVANVDVPRPVPGQALPRFLRLKIVTATATYTAGDILGAIVIDRFDQTTSTTGALSGYPAGVTVAN